MPRPIDPRLQRLAGGARWVVRLVASLLVLGFLAVAVVLLGPQLLEQLDRVREGEWQGPLVMLIFAIPFVAAPLFMLTRLWKRRKPAGADAAPEVVGAQEAAAPRRRRSSAGSWGCIVGPALFLAVGLAFAAFFLVPLWRVVQALRWDPVPCEILSSHVETHSSEDGATYSIEVRYRYEVDGRSFQGRRYRFLNGSSSGYEGKQRVVDALAPGTTTTCWVSPADPEESVLHRGLSWEFLFGLLPLVFVAVGAAGLYLAWQGRSRKSRGAAAIEPGTPIEPGGETTPGRPGLLERWSEHEVLPEAPAPGELALEPALSPLGKLGCIVGVALFWNGIVSVFLWQLWREPHWALGCFLTPFVLIGLALLAAVPYQLLALANPRPHLVLADARLAPGRSTMLRWSFSGATGRLQSVRIRLEGREKVRYGSGDSSTTRQRVFARVRLVEESQRGLLSGGDVRLEIPAGAMHSLSGRNNWIEWVLTVHGSIARWPDVQDEFAVVVLPEAAP
ncbi:MAG: DUF3592 domain-containing protein [Thermoanaerobaculia bacterium]